MAPLPIDSLRRCAVLAALQQAPLYLRRLRSLNKLLYLTDISLPAEKRLLTFHRGEFGEYSEQVAAILNELMTAGRLTVAFEGADEVLTPNLTPVGSESVTSIVRMAFPAWRQALSDALARWSQLGLDDVLRLSPQGKEQAPEQGQVIFASQLPDTIEVHGLDVDEAERLLELVSPSFWAITRQRLSAATKRMASGSDWRREYFDDLADDPVSEAHGPHARHD